MHTLLYPLLSAAATGLALSVVVHLAALLGVPSPLGEKSWILHGGIFVVWIPAVFILQPLTREFKQKDLWRAAFRGCPVWMRRFVWVIFAYAMINFAVFFYLSASAKPSPGQTPDAVLRGFSGHWMVFYSIAFAVFYSALRIREHDAQRRCLDGHPVSPSAKFCEHCGQPIREVPVR
jgi:hypothetical protein